MASFFVDLWNSIFTPGPTPSIMVATNVSFAALQIILFALLIATYSVHFAVLSFLSASLWWAINWFVRELNAATEKEKAAEQLRQLRKAREQDAQLADSGSETEGAAMEESTKGGSNEIDSAGFLSPGRGAQGQLRKRQNQADSASTGDLSTDSEWDKVEEAGNISQ